MSRIATVDTEALLAIWQKLGSEHDRSTARRVAEVLAEVVRSKEYAAWSDTTEMAGDPLVFPHGIPGKDVLRTVGLVGGDTFRVKPNFLRGRVLVTDGFWVDGRFRVFPTTDESAVLLSYAERHGLFDWADVLVDPSTGSGNHVIGFPAQIPRLALDVNPRAIAYTRINQRLNGLSSLATGIHDITDGLPFYAKLLEGHVLFIVNMPFALSPVKGEVLPLSADGGPSGATLTLAALRALQAFRATRAPGAAAKAIVLAYSLGSRERDRWFVAEQAGQMFGADSVRWEIQTQEKMWRVNGVKAEPNPMRLNECLPKKADCRFHVGPDADRAALRKGYIDLAAFLNGEGWEDLGYGVLEVDLGT